MGSSQVVEHIVIEVILWHVAGHSALYLGSKLLLHSAKTAEWTRADYVAKLSSLMAEVDIVLVKEAGCRVIIKDLVSSWWHLLLLPALCLMEGWLGITAQVQIVRGRRDAGLVVLAIGEVQLSG